MDQLYDTEPGQPRVPLRATPEGYLIVQIAGGGGGGGSSVTNLTTTVSPTNVVVASDTGTDATIPLADVTNAGAMPPAAVQQLAVLGTASEADVGDFAAADHTHALLMTTDERTKLGALPAAADLTTSLAGKIANTLPAMQTAFSAGTALEKAAFQSSVSGGGLKYQEPGFGGMIYGGDSFTADAGAGPTTGYSKVLHGLIGAPWVNVSNIVNGGVAGERSDQIAARLPALIAANPTVRNLVIECGANDATQLVPTVTYTANVESMVRLGKQAGCRVLVYSPPPRRSPATHTTAIRGLLAEYKVAAKALCIKYGVAFADIDIDLQDKATGDLISTYSADGLHVNTTGHWLMANRGAVAFMATYPRPASSLSREGAPNLVGNSLFLTDLTGWSQAGAGATFRHVDDPYGRLEYGRCASLEFATGTGAITLSRAVTATGADTWAVGDTMVLEAQLYLDDSVLTGYVDKVTSGGALLAKIGVLNQSSVQIADIQLAAGPRAGRLSKEFIVPAGTTGMIFTVSIYNGAAIPSKMYAGGLALYSKTKYPGLKQH